MKNIEAIREQAGKKGIDLSDVVKAPRSDKEKAEGFRDICSTNRCGNYGISWTCPPAVGSAEDCLERMHSYDNAVISKMTFNGIDMKDMTQLKRIADIHQNSCRDIMHMFREEGFDVLVLGDGACNNCEECSYPEECVSPDQRIPSVSGYGIDMSAYITECGSDFGFSDDSVTFYGLILFK